MEKLDYLLDKTNLLMQEISEMEETDNSLQTNLTTFSNIALANQTNISNLQTSVNKINSNISNPNLLINGDFRVNQRGFSSTSSSGYTVDRWHNYNANATVTLNIDNSIILENISSDNANGYYIQYINPTEEKMWGNTYTMSCKFDDGKIISKAITFPASFSTTTGLGTSETYKKLDVRGYLYNATKFGFTIDVLPDAEATIVWCKLELGEICTPQYCRPYAEELALCQRYYQQVSVSGGSGTALNMGVARNSTAIRFFLNLTQTLRTAPTIISSDISLLNCTTNNFFSITNNAFSLQCISNNLLTLTYNASSSIGSNGNIFYISDTNGKAKIKIVAEIY